MFRKLATIALASLAIAAPASAELTRLPGSGSGFMFMAQDVNGEFHYMEAIRQDHNGDYQLEVSIADGPNTYRWVDCKLNNITSIDGDSWINVDHSTMNGHYYDAACRPELGTSMGYQMGMMTYEEDRQFYRGERY